MHTVKHPYHSCVSSRFSAARGLLLLALLFLLSGCAGTTTFTSYPSKVDPLIKDVMFNRPPKSELLVKECQSKDQLLYRMERGRIAQIRGDVDASRQDFAAAMESLVEKDQRATISASKIASQGAAVMVNDNAIPYEGAGYERVMLHHLQAMNYLSERDLEGAGVEVRRANAEQAEALKRHEKELDKAQAEAEKNKVKSTENNELTAAYAGLDEVAGQVKNSFQNAYTFYVSGIVYEMLGQPNDAYIDYKKALEIFPDNSYLQRDVVRLATALSMDDDLAEFRHQFEPEILSVAGSRRQAAGGELVVLFEDGFVPQKQEVKIAIPLISSKGLNGYTSVAFPVYQAGVTKPRSLTLTWDAQEIGQTELIANIEALAVKALKEQVPAMLIRQTVRATAKAVMAKAAKDQLGLLGSVASSVYNLASENADLRSWITLPANAQILRVDLPAGAHRLALTHQGSGVSKAVEIEVKPGGKTILHVVRAGNQLYSQEMVF